MASNAAHVLNQHRYPLDAPLLSGKAAVDAARAIKNQHDIDTAWPFDWEYAPRDSANVFQQGILAAPVAGTFQTVLQYAVPDSCKFVLRDLTLFFQGSAYTPGDFIWKVSVDSPSGSSAQAMAFRNFGVVQTTLGDLVRPWRVRSGERDKVGPKSIVRAQVKNVNITVSPSNVFTAMFVGYTIPQNGAQG